MRKILALTLIVGMAVLVGGVAGAAGDDGTSNPAGMPCGAHYDWSGPEGELSIVGEPGSHYAVFDAVGLMVADGTLDGCEVRFRAGNSGVGPDGVVLFVLVNDDILAVTDPDWNWD